tara:strand:- start:477 stop:785 length:309 start_codon:yes stop_codon:yes gene_type:complete
MIESILSKLEFSVKFIVSVLAILLVLCSSSIFFGIRANKAAKRAEAETVEAFKEIRKTQSLIIEIQTKRFELKNDTDLNDSQYYIESQYYKKRISELKKRIK